MLVTVLVAVLVIILIGYIVNALVTSSGSDLQGNSIDDFILNKDVTVIPSTNTKKYRYYERFSVVAGCQLRIVYGTEYGASEDVAKCLYRRIHAMIEQGSKRYQPRVVNCKDYIQIDWKQEELILFIISTSGDGFPPTDAVLFMDYIKSLPQKLEQLHYSVLALGDSNYPHFCKTGIQLDDRLANLGAERIVRRHNVDMENQDTIDKWMDSVLDAITNLDVHASLDYLPQYIQAKQLDAFHRNNPFYATIVRTEILTTSTCSDDRETVHVEFNLTESSLTWQSGDALGVYPHNSIAEVKDLLTHAKMTGMEMVIIDNDRSADDTVPLEKVLTEYFNVKDISSALIKYFRCYVELDSLLGEVRDLLSSYPSVRISPQELVNCLKPLQPRYYSISSSAAVEPYIASITVAAVRYKLMEIDRTGVCSIHLFDRCYVGDRLGVFISRNENFRLPSDSDTDILMIGPGTGIAPFVSFITERIFYRAKGKMTLYFGCRSSNKDFIYRERLEKWSNEDVIKLYCAFSRKNIDKKIYVQHLMAETKQSKDIYHHMQGGGHVYICGDASQMAHDVHNTLLDIIRKEGALGLMQAKQYLDDMVANNRYQKDVWVT